MAKAKSLEQIKEEIRKAEAKKKKLLAQQKAAEEAAFAAIGKLVAERPELLTAEGWDAVREFYPDLADAQKPTAKNAV